MNTSEPQDLQHQGSPIRREVTKRPYVNYRKRIETIMESFTDGFFEVDAQWMVTYWNRTAEELLHRAKHEIVGKHLWESYPEATELRFYSEYHRCMAQQASTRFEEYFHPLDMWLEVAVFPNSHGLSVYFKDITQRKQIEAQLEGERRKYRELFDLNPLPQWVYDIETLAFLDVNEAAIAHYGYSRETFLSTDITSIRPVQDVDELKDILKNINLSGQSLSRPVRHVKANGELIHAQVIGKSIEFYGRPARLVVVVDKTTEIQAQFAKEQSISKLQEISWIQAHEVRKPLSNLLGIASLLEGEQGSGSNAILIAKLISQADELDSIIKKTMTKIHPVLNGPEQGDNVKDKPYQTLAYTR